MSAPPESEWPRRSDARGREKEDRLNEDVRGFVELVGICSPVCVDRVDSLRAQRQTVRECSHSQQHFRVIYFYRNLVCRSVSCWKDRRKRNTSVFVPWRVDARENVCRGWSLTVTTRPDYGPLRSFSYVTSVPVRYILGSWCRASTIHDETGVSLPRRGLAERLWWVRFPYFFSFLRVRFFPHIHARTHTRARTTCVLWLPAK